MIRWCGCLLCSHKNIGKIVDQVVCWLELLILSADDKITIRHAVNFLLIHKPKREISNRKRTRDERAKFIPCVILLHYLWVWKVLNSFGILKSYYYIKVFIFSDYEHRNATHADDEKLNDLLTSCRSIFKVLFLRRFCYHQRRAIAVFSILSNQSFLFLKANQFWIIF